MTSRLVCPPGTAPQQVIAYGFLIVAAEGAIRFVGPTVGVLIHAVLLLALVSQVAFARTPQSAVLPAFAMLPVVRLVGIVLSVEGIPAVARWALVTLPALIAVAMVVRTLRISLGDVGLRPRPSPPWQYLIPLTGIPLGGLLRVTAGADARLNLDSSPLLIVAAAAVSVVILEELLFRGLLQHLFARFGEPVAIFATSTLYAAMYLNAGPLVGVAVMALAGLIFSWFRSRTGALYGGVGAHLVLRVIVEA